jgi:hypothetical protein
MAGSVHIPWYATGFRGDAFEEALREIAPVALRYGATAYSVFRYRDDRYKFIQTATFDDKLAWERYWGGAEMTRFRTVHQGRYQVPVVYQWADIIIEGALPANGKAPEEPTSIVGGPETGDAQAV